MAIVPTFVRRLLGERAATPPSMYTAIEVTRVDFGHDHAQAVVLRIAAEYRAEPQTNRHMSWSGAIALALDPATPTQEIHSALIAAAQRAIRGQIDAQGYNYTIGPSDIYRVIGLSIA